MHGVEQSQSIEFQMSLLLFVALAGYILASRIAQPGYVSLVLMSLLTTLIVPLVLRNWLYRNETLTPP